MKVCICDDEERERKVIRKLCKQFFLKKGVECEISEAENALKAAMIIKDIDLLLLDIEMPGMDGLALKELLQKESSKCIILFITGHDEWISEAFGMRVLGFIEKNFLLDKLPRYLNKALDIMGRDILLDRKYHSRDIVMIHSEKEYCKLYFRDKMEVLLRSSLTKLEEELASVDFVRVGRAWLVNLKYVENIGRGEVVLADAKVPVSRGASGRLREAYEDYCERNARYF